MTQLFHPQPLEVVIYPDCDGQPMSDNTKQFRWIVTLKENIEWLFAHDPDVFVAGDLLWYPVEDNAKTRQAPDVMVAFGRPKGDRGSYKQWQENNIAPQVVFEILSPGNTRAEMSRKLLFYDRFGVEEYYLYDPDLNDLTGWLRVDGFLDLIDSMQDWVSPRLGLRFDYSEGDELQLFRPDGKKCLTYTEIARQAEQAQQQAEQAQQQAEQAQQQAEQERLRADRLATYLRSQGIDPDTIV
jgi:Uma2 family endonuclease